MLCPPCQRIFLPGGCTVLEIGGMIIPIFEHHSSGPNFRKAALDGCGFCLRMWDSLTTNQQNDLSTNSEPNEEAGKFAEGTVERRRSGVITCQIQQFVT